MEDGILKISARNHIKGAVESVDKGAIMASIKIKVETPDTITAIITKEAAEELGIKKGEMVTAIIKATEIMIGKE